MRREKKMPVSSLAQMKRIVSAWTAATAQCPRPSQLPARPSMLKPLSRGFSGRLDSLRNPSGNNKARCASLSHRASVGNFGAGEGSRTLVISLGS